MLPCDSACRTGQFARYGCPDSQLAPSLLRPCSCDLREAGTRIFAQRNHQVLIQWTKRKFITPKMRMDYFAQ